MMSFISEIGNRGFLEHLLFSCRFSDPDVGNWKLSFTLRYFSFGFLILTLICVCFFILDLLLDQSASFDQIDHWSRSLLILSYFLCFIYCFFTLFLLIFIVCITVAALIPTEELRYCPLIKHLHCQLVSEFSSSPFGLRVK